MLLSWSRGLLGIFFGLMAMFILDTNKGKWQNEVIAAPVFLVLSALLLSPVSNKVFAYPPPNRAQHGKWRWGGKSSALLFFRMIGFFFTAVSAALLTIKDVTLAESLFCLAWGLAFIFITQLKQLFTSAAQVAAEPVLITTGQAPIAIPAIQADQPVAVVVSLSEQYNHLQHLPATNKGVFYGAFLTRLFNNENVLTSGAFTVKDTLISGSFDLDGHIYLLAAKWQPEQSNEEALLIFNAKVESRSTWARGIFISEAGFTKDGLTRFANGKPTSIIGMDGKDLQLVLAGKLSLIDAIKRKARRAVETNHFFVPLQELI
jgi:hypothetical protein